MTFSHLNRVLAAATAVGAVASAFSAAAWADQLPARVHAEYEITFNGLKVGGFDFTAENTAATYKMTGSGKVSVLFGAFKWSGASSASGAVGKGGAAVPADFKFDLKGKIKGGTTAMAFQNGAVAKVDMTPPPKVKPDMIPLQPQHLTGVFDPMAAVMMMTRGGNDPCNRVVPVFEGQRRLDVTLSPQGTVPIETAEASKAMATGFVCRVNYKLIAGHRPGDETTYMHRNQHVEMVLRPVPSANIYVPYEISASTLLGKIRVHSKRVTITPAEQGRQQIVLVYEK